MSKTKTRHFYVVVNGNIDNQESTNAIRLKTKGDFPSMEKIKKFVLNSIPSFTNILILSITELSETDYKQFYGKE